MAQEEDEEISGRDHTLKTHSTFEQQARDIKSRLENKRYQSPWSDEEQEGTMPDRTATELTKTNRKGKKTFVSGFDVSGEAIEVPKSKSPASVVTTQSHPTPLKASPRRCKHQSQSESPVEQPRPRTLTQEL